MAAPKSTPKDAQVMAAILKDMGVSEYEPRVINHMLELTYRYVTDVLDDAKVYSSHANKRDIDSDDIKLAVQCKLDHSFTAPPPKQLLVELAKQKNSVPLPVIKPYSGPKLPPDRYCLSATNYKLRSVRKPKSNWTITPKAQQTSWTTTPTMQQNQVRVMSQSASGVRPSPSSTLATPQQMYNRLNAMQTIPTTPTTLFSGTKRQHEDDDYDSVM